MFDFEFFRFHEKIKGVTTVSETIPAELQPEVEAALVWWNRKQATAFEVTGILDPEQTLASSSPRELRLVLCGGDRCEQRSFRVAEETGGFAVDLLEDAPATGAQSDRQAELDPPPGARRGWLDATLSCHAFTLILFYRGFW